MAGVSRFALRRSKLTIGMWIAAVVLCAAVGLASRDSFTPTDLVVPGSQGERWLELTHEADFGTNINLLLDGPERDLQRQGAAVTKELRNVPGLRVVSPFDRPTGDARARREELAVTRRGDSALFIIYARLRPGQELADTMPPVRRVVDSTVRPPVTARITGQPAIAEGLIEESYSATREAEIIAVPLLLLVLLLVFRSPVAAAVPAIVGFGTVIAGGGIVQALSTVTTVDQLALSLGSMMGLALGVDYSLLLVSRYREHRRVAPAAVGANIEAASLATGRTIVFAAVLLVAVMVVAAVLSVGPVLASAALGVGVVTVVGALTSLLVTPALLRELDPWMERWRLPSFRRRGASRLAGRHPIAIPLAALVALLALAAPTLAIDPGSPDVKLLPDDAPTRVEYEEVGKVVGPGFGAVFDVVIRSRGDRPVTTARSLDAVARLQRRLASDRGVATVIGPAAIERQTRGLPRLERQLASQQKGLSRLDRGLSRASDGVRLAGGGAAELHAATGQTHRGADRLASGLRAAAGGSERLIGGLVEASRGGERLADGSRQARVGAGRLADGLEQARTSSNQVSNNARVLENDLRTGNGQLDALHEPVETADRRLATAWRALQRMTVGRNDPQFGLAVEAVRAASEALTGTDPSSGEAPDPAYEGVAAGMKDAEGQFSLGLYLTNRLEADGRKAQRGVRRLARGAKRLHAGVGRIAAGNAQVSDGLQRLSRHSAGLAPGLGQLSDGTERLADGLGQVEAGAGQLAGGLGGPDGGGRLASGLERIRSGVAGQQEKSSAGDLAERSPRLFESGLLPLALADGTRRPTKERTQMVLDLKNGGRTARVTVIPRYATSDARIDGLHERITEASDQLDGSELETAVGGPAGLLQQFQDATSARLPLLVAAFALVSFLILVLGLRAVPLAAMCVALNLLTVCVTFGVMQIGFGGSDPLLGGPGYVDVVALSGALTVVFALSIDYQIFLLSRIREEYSASGSNERALEAGIGSTGGVITGAAAVMVVIFLAFATSDYIAIREVGIGLAVAVFLDATVVRLVLLPAAMRLIGDRTWWLPSWLDRAMPRVSL